MFRKEEIKSEKLTVLQRQVGMLQQPPLLRIHHGGFVWCDAEKGGIEQGDILVEEMATANGDLMR